MADAPRQVLQAFAAYLLARREPLLGEWLAGVDWTAPLRALAPAEVPVLCHLPALRPFAAGAEAALVARMIEHGSGLAWRRTYAEADFGRHFHRNYAHVELVGPRGHLPCSVLAAGLALYGPGVDYPDHWHAAREIYIPLTGTGRWSRDRGPYRSRAAGDLILNESDMPHAMRTQDEPMLALWIWRGGDLAQKSRTGRAPG